MSFKRQSFIAKGVGDLIPPYPLAAAASVEVEVVIQAAPTTAARVMWAGIRIMPGLTAITAAQIGAMRRTSPRFRAVSSRMEPRTAVSTAGITHHDLQ